MDSDCLIKFTKAGLKELIVEHYEVFIPSTVEFAEPSLISYQRL